MQSFNINIQKNERTPDIAYVDMSQYIQDGWISNDGTNKQSYIRLMVRSQNDVP